MALSLKWQYKGEEVDAICRVYGINVMKGNWLSVLGAAAVSSNNQSRGFFYTAHFRVTKADDESITLFFGEMNIPYDINGVENVIRLAYLKLKSDYPEFKDAVDI